MRLAAAQDQDPHMKKPEEELYMRVRCTSIGWVGDHGAIVGLQQFNDIDAPHHSVELPFEFPILLSALESDAWAACMDGVPSFLNDFNQPLDSLAICEVRVHAEPGDRPGEVIIAEARAIPQSDRDDGLIRLERHVIEKTEHRAAVSLGEALLSASPCQWCWKPKLCCRLQKPALTACAWSSFAMAMQSHATWSFSSCLNGLQKLLSQGFLHRPLA